MTRPGRLFVVVGTGTEVGKTWVGARALEAWRASGRTVGARKPVQSFDPSAGGPTDAEVLARATGEDPSDVCAPERTLPLPVAPPMAAAALGRAPIHLAALVAAATWPAGLDVGLVETVGGVRAPIADDGDSRDLARALAPDLVLLVADAGLGTISDVRLAADALAPLPVAVVLNRFDPSDGLHARNAEWLAGRDGLFVAVASEPGWAGRLLDLSADVQARTGESRR